MNFFDNLAVSDSKLIFGDYELNWSTHELLRRGTQVAVERKALELLHYLLVHRDRTVSKDEISRAIWPDRVVSDSVISQTISKARSAVDDDGERQKFISTVRGFGYRFVHPVKEQRDAPMPLGQSERTEPETAPRPENLGQASQRRLVPYLATAALLVIIVAVAFSLRPGSDADNYINPAWASADRPPLVGILPFHQEQSSVGDRALAQTLVEALHMRLAEMSDIEIRSPRIISLLLEEEPGPGELMAKAEVDFLLSGILEPSLSADRRELNLELILDREGSLQAVPLGRFSIPYPDSAESLASFIMQRDAIVTRLTQTLLPAMVPRLADREIGTLNPDAFRLLLAAIREVRAVQCDSHEVKSMLRRAIEIDQTFDHARMALAWVAYAQFRNCGQSEDVLQEARSQIQQVLARHAHHPVALLINTLIQVENGQIEEACELLQPALEHHPTSPQLRLSLAHALTFAGFLNVAAEELDALIASDPLFLSFEKPHLPLAYFYQGRIDDFLAAAPSLDVPTFRYYRALAELMRGDEAAASALLITAAQGNPADLGTRMSEALLAILDDRSQSAIELITSLTSTPASKAALNGETLFQLGRLLHLAGADEQALDHFELALGAGFFCLACLENDAELATIADHPRWLEIAQEAQQRQLAMVDRLADGPLISRLKKHQQQLAHALDLWPAIPY